MDLRCRKLKRVSGGEQDMKMFSQCSGECCVCRCGTACLAGHGDDDYIPARKEQVIDRLDKGMYPNYRKQMKEYLLERFSFNYEERES